MGSEYIMEEREGHVTKDGTVLCLECLNAILLIPFLYFEQGKESLTLSYMHQGGWIYRAVKNISYMVRAVNELVWAMTW